MKAHLIYSGLFVALITMGCGSEHTEPTQQTNAPAAKPSTPAPAVSAPAATNAPAVVAPAPENPTPRADIFRSAGFEWREPGCSMCFFAGGESLGKGVRVASTTNRNFEGRQGLDVRTHIASPLTVVASACAGHLVADTTA